MTIMVSVVKRSDKKWKPERLILIFLEQYDGIYDELMPESIFYSMIYAST